jgi:excisionase family DNA binding protein
MPTAPTPNTNGGSSTSRQLVFTSSQAAVYLGVSLATIRRWTDAGHISCYRTPGGQRRFSRDQLDSFTESLRRGSRDEQQTAQHTVVTRSGRAVVA